MLSFPNYEKIWNENLTTLNEQITLSWFFQFIFEFVEEGESNLKGLTRERERERESYATVWDETQKR